MRRFRVEIFIDLRNPIQSRLLPGIARFRHTRTDWDIYLHRDPWLPERDLAALPRCDGMLLPNATPEIVPRLGKHAACVILSEVGADIPQIRVDDEAIGALGATYLLAKGFRQLAFMALPYRYANDQIMDLG